MRLLAVSGLWTLLSFSCRLDAPTSASEVTEVASGNWVGLARYPVRLRHTDLIDVEVMFPSDAEGKPRGVFPGVIFIQGGAVEPQRYHWWANALAAEGYVVALPPHALNLAIFSIDNAAAAKELLMDPPKGSVLDGHVAEGPMAVMGHSLGGVVATKLALRGDFQVLGLFASFPDPADEGQLDNLKASTLMLAAEKDCQAKLSVIEEATAKLPDPKVLVVLPEATHFQFTDSQAPDEARGCAPTVSLEDTHVRVVKATKVFLDEALAGRGAGKEALLKLPGVEVR